MAEGDADMVKCLTAKEIKKIARPEFAANFEKFYPVETLRNLGPGGFHRANCPECKNNFWKLDKNKVTCGDSLCEKAYSFIGVGCGIGKGPNGKKITYADAWQGFQRSLTTAAVPCTSIPRYPVVARWRADVDYVAAGIFCFQPYCVTGELEPPANPLICPQFCLRFNDLDNIGLTGRHYSGFIMLGIQVFNRPGDKKFGPGQCIEFNYRWLTEELGIDPMEITFIEDVWAGGGNLGPSIEYFVGGLELGNMVFMQFKTFPDGSREPLQVSVIDVGIGLERVPWLINGTPTSYNDVFERALAYFLSKTGVSIEADIWDKYGPYSCLLNVDEVEDLGATWDWIAAKIGSTADEVKEAVEPVKDVYVVLDHTRCVLMAIMDGSLPSNVGGAQNVRNILRRVFAVLHKHGWWDSMGMEGLLELFEAHKADLASVYGEFKPYESFRAIIELEYERWKFTDGVQGDKLRKLLKKRKNKLTLDDWIVCMTSWGLPADTIAQVSKSEIPGNLWYEIAERQEKLVKVAPTVLYNTAHLAATDSLYYVDHKKYKFQAKILEVFPMVTKNNVPAIVVVDESAFYPTSGGQEHDMGKMWIEGKEYDVVDVLKVGPCVLHVLDPPLPDREDLDSWKGLSVTGEVEQVRREQLRNNHTATHIMYASCRAVLGPHCWQHGAKKTPKQAHLDITHYKSLTHEETMAIQTEANRIVHRCRQITKGFMAKDKAEKAYGFHLYQGGVVPGNTLRVVNIADTDTEACCGTHCDNTAEVGSIKILKTNRISDGILRLYFVAGENALMTLNRETTVLHGLSTMWGVQQTELTQTADRFFTGYKQLSTKVAKQDQKLLSMTMKLHVLDPESKCIISRTDQANPTLFISQMPHFAKGLKAGKKGAVFVGETFVYGLLGDISLFDAKKELEPVLLGLYEEEVAKQEERNSKSAEDDQKGEEEKKATPVVSIKKCKLIVKNNVVIKPDKKLKKKAKKEKITDLVEFSCFTLPGEGAATKLTDFLVSKGFVLQE